MLQQPFYLSLLIFSFMLNVLSVSTANSNVYFRCSQLNFTSMTPYESNLNSQFTSLVDSASIYNFNKLETSPETDRIYGLFQCRSDLSSPDCKDCVISAVSQLKTTCPMSIGGEIQLEGCFVKYDDKSFFGAQDKMEVLKTCGPSTGYNSDVSNRIDGALTSLVGDNGQYFRRGDFGSVQGVAQCVQDLSISDCQDCLSEASGRLRSECETSTWGDMYLGKCYIRYADQGNLNLGNDDGDSTSHKRKRKGKGRKFKTSILIVSTIFSFLGGVGITVGVSFTCVNCCNKNVYNISGRRENKERDAAKYEAKIAKEKVEKLEKELEEAKKKCESKIWVLPPPPPPYFPMPPPCPC